MRILSAAGVLLVLAALLWLGAGAGANTPALVLAGLGVLFLLAAAFAGMTRFMESSHAAESDLGPAEVRLLIQSMASMATADGTVAPAEIDAFALIYSKTTGLMIDPQDIRRILGDFEPDFDIADRLRKNRSNLSPQYRRLILRSCEEVMVSDEITASAERAKLEDIRMALGLADIVDKPGGV